MSGFTTVLRPKLSAFCTALIALLFGRWSPTLQILLILMLCDYLTGLAVAWQLKTLSSRIGFIGISRKIAMFGLIALGYQIDILLGSDILRDACALFYIANEAISIVENCAGIGVPLPPALLKALKALHGKEENDKYL